MMEGRRVRGKELKPRAINHAEDFTEFFYFIYFLFSSKSNPTVKQL